MALALIVSFAIPAAARAWPTVERWELRTGYGYQYKHVKARPNNYQIVFLLPSAVVPMTKVVGPAWLRGRFTWNPELFLGMFIHPYDRPILGVNPLQFRYELEPWRGRLAPYLMVDAGVLYANVNRRETGTDLNFNLSGAVGARCRLSDRWSALLEYRHLHISNAGLHEENSGLNANTFLAGVSLQS